MRYILFTFFIIISFSLTAQKKYSTTKKKAIAEFELAEKLYYNAQYKDAVSKLDIALNKDENFIEAYLLKAQIYFEINDIENEIIQYEKALEINRNYTSKIQYLLSVAYFNNEQYKASLDICKEAQQMGTRSARLERLIEDGIEAAAFALELYENPVPYEPINLGDKVNSPYDDYWPMLSTNGTRIYTTKKIPIINDMPISQRNANEDFFINFLNNDSVWDQARSIQPLNTRGNEGAPSISADGQTFVFTACNRQDGLGKCDIYIAKRRRNGWTRPQNIGAPINSNLWETQPSISSDGKTIYFVRPVGRSTENNNLWVSHFEDEKWSEPIQLGDSINTKQREEAPFIHPDGQTLYFVSNGHLGMGGLDIFKSTRTNDTTWSKPQNIGYPINTVYDEQSLFVSVSGDVALISSDRALDDRGLEIYSFELPQEAKPNYVSYVEGYITDAKTNLPVQAKIELIDLNTSELLVQPESDPETGKYLLCLPPNREYMINISNQGYLPYSDHLFLGSESRLKPLKKDIKLQPIEINAQVVLKNIFFELDSYQLKEKSKLELAKLIEFINKNTTVSIEISGHTDNQGSKQHNLILSNNRAETVYDYLIENEIQASRLSFKGYGFDQAIDSNDTSEGRANNRRTEFKIIGL